MDHYMSRQITLLDWDGKRPCQYLTITLSGPFEFSLFRGYQYFKLSLGFLFIQASW